MINRKVHAGEQSCCFAAQLGRIAAHLPQIGSKIAPVVERIRAEEQRAERRGDVGAVRHRAFELLRGAGQVGAGRAEGGAVEVGAEAARAPRRAAPSRSAPVRRAIDSAIQSAWLRQGKVAAPRKNSIAAGTRRSSPRALMTSRPRERPLEDLGRDVEIGRRGP